MDSTSGSFWAGRRVLVTGHTGFKGAWLALWLQERGAHVVGLALPAEDPAGAFAAMDLVQTLDSRYVDLRDQGGVTALVGAVDPEVIFHLGAQALVRRGYADPFATYATNAVGTINLLHAIPQAPSVRAVVVATSDKVYKDHDDAGPSTTPARESPAFRESDPLGGDDPYSGSKALAELLVDGCRRTCLAEGGAGIATARAGNVIGGGDQGEDRLLPDAWRALEAGETLRVRHPQAVRPWQFVLEPLCGYLLLAEQLVAAPDRIPPAINFGPDPGGSETVAGVLDRVYARWGSGGWAMDEGSHVPEAKLLRLDSSLAGEVLGWRPRLSLDEALEWTLEWWRGSLDGRDLRRLAIEQISAYESRSP